MSPEPPLQLDLDEGLRRLGFESFRPGQREAIEQLLQVGSLLLVAPTGGGKSLTYQLPASLFAGTTLVISPLVALMQDQVDAAQAMGIEATCLASTLDGEEIRRRMRGIARREYKLVFVAPERLAVGGFRNLAADLDLDLLAVDEAHCISEWGHDFRPEYLQIGSFLRHLRPRRVLACTATATPVVRDEIIDKLGLPAQTPQVIHGFARPNLSLRVVELRAKKERDGHVDQLLQEALGSHREPSGAAILYAPSRKATGQEADRLTRRGWKAAAYHAGMTGNARERVQRSFSQGKIDVVVATNAFGMGIDRADVRAVVHLAPPWSIEAYYQEVGRAGRDGEPACGLMLVSPSDIPMRRRLLERGTEDFTPDPAIVEHKWSLFLELMRWAEGGSCRHDGILRYFGDEAETLQGCGRCDVCQSLGERPDDETTTLVVRKALSAIARIHGRFGLTAAIKLLRGSADPRLERSGLTQTRTFGALEGHSEDWIGQVLRRCVTAGWADFSAGDRPVVYLTDDGKAVMKGERPARMLLPETGARKSSKGSGGGAAGKPGPSAVELDDRGRELFEALRAHRLERAKAEDVPPYVVASDRTLREIAMLRPRNADELRMAHGIGPAKLEKYGDGLLAVVATAS